MDCTEWDFYASKAEAMKAGRALQRELEQEAGELGEGEQP
jgi:hypothetical protein